MATIAEHPPARAATKDPFRPVHINVSPSTTGAGYVAVLECTRCGAIVWRGTGVATHDAFHRTLERATGATFAAQVARAGELGRDAAAGRTP